MTRLDLNDILIRNPQASFLMRVAGTSMRDAGIDDGDLVLIDRAVTPANGHVVIAVVEQEFVCRQLVKCATRSRPQNRRRSWMPAGPVAPTRRSEDFVPFSHDKWKKRHGVGD